MRRRWLYLIRARTAAPDDVPTLTHFASVCIRRDLGPDAIEALERARRLEPSNMAVVYLLARANISVQNWQQAYDLFQQFSKHDPGFAPTYYAMGWLDIRLNHLSDARQQLEHSLRLQPTLSGARYELAQLEFDDGQIDQAQKLLETVLRENPHHAKANMAMGDILLRKGDVAGAQKFLETAVREDPKLAGAHYKLSLLYLREHEMEKSAAEKTLAANLNEEEKRSSKTQLRLVLPEVKATVDQTENVIRHTTITVRTQGKGLYPFTRQVQDWISKQGISNGLATIFIQHTSCSLVIQENADPDVTLDLRDFFERLVPEDGEDFRHTAEGPDDMTSHIRSALTQTSVSVPLISGQLALGTWQGLVCVRAPARPHQRRVVLQLMGS